MACPLLQKGLGHLAALYLLLLLVARYKLSYHKTICYHLFQYVQRIPCWKPLIISFCSSLGSGLLLIYRTTIDPLYLWVISDSQAGHLTDSIGAQVCIFTQRLLLLRSPFIEERWRRRAIGGPKQLFVDRTLYFASL